MHLAATEQRQPFIKLRFRNGIVSVHGEEQAELGHALDIGEGRRDGIYAYWRWDGERLEAGNDRYGFHPLYYYANGSELILSPSVLTLLAKGAAPELDDDALAVFLRLGFFVGNDTPFRAIRALPPSAHLHWRYGRLELRYELPLMPRQEITRANAIARYDELFRQAVQRRLPTERPLVPLTGGCDSRHILLELCRQGVRPECVTVGPMPPFSVDEGVVAGQLAERLGLPHTRLSQPRSQFRQDLGKNLLTDFCADEHDWYMPVVEWLQQRPGSIYDGIAGDVLSAPLFLTREHHELYRRGEFRKLAGSLMPYEKTLAHMLSPSAYQRFSRERAVVRVERELARYQRAATPIKAFFLFNRTRREIALIPYAMLRDCGTVYSPYLDHDLYDFLASLPPELLFEPSLHVEAIHAGFPEHADLPFAPPQRGDSPNRRFAKRYAWEVGRYAGTGRSHLVRRGYVLARAARSMVDVEYSKRLHVSVGPLATYLIQLERYAEDFGAVQDARVSVSPEAGRGLTDARLGNTMGERLRPRVRAEVDSDE